MKQLLLILLCISGIRANNETYCIPPTDDSHDESLRQSFVTVGCFVAAYLAKEAWAYLSTDEGFEKTVRMFRNLGSVCKRVSEEEKITQEIISKNLSVYASNFLTETLMTSQREGRSYYYEEAKTFLFLLKNPLSQMSTVMALIKNEEFVVPKEDLADTAYAGNGAVKRALTNVAKNIKNDEEAPNVERLIAKMHDSKQIVYVPTLRGLELDPETEENLQVVVLGQLDGEDYKASNILLRMQNIHLEEAQSSSRGAVILEEAANPKEPHSDKKLRELYQKVIPYLRQIGPASATNHQTDHVLQVIPARAFRAQQRAVDAFKNTMSRAPLASHERGPITPSVFSQGEQEVFGFTEDERHTPLEEVVTHGSSSVAPSEDDFQDASSF